MKLLIDQDIHSGTAALLRDLGDDAMNLLETGLSRSPVDVVIEFAVSEGRVIATLDADYHRIVATPIALDALGDFSPSANSHRRRRRRSYPDGMFAV